MSTIKKAITVGVSAAGIAAGATMMFPTVASAASYGGQCGAGYNVIDTHQLKGGTIFLTYNGSQNCVVTVRDHGGAPEPMGAGVELTHGAHDVTINQGNFTEYAGPVFVPAKGKCIDWAGFIRDDKWQQFNVHCNS